MESELIENLVELREAEVLKLVSKMLDEEKDPQAILNACHEGMVMGGMRKQKLSSFLSREQTRVAN